MVRRRGRRGYRLLLPAKDGVPVHVPGRAEYDEITEIFGDLYPDASVPKNAGRWIASVQHHMARAGQHRSASAVDLMIAATAAHHGLTVLHDDADYRAVARHAPDLSEHNIRHVT